MSEKKEYQYDSKGWIKQDDTILNTPQYLSAITPEIISRQATINIGTIGHVAHGKSTCINALSGVKTVRFKDELERNITIKLGYANSKIYKCKNAECKSPECYTSKPSSTKDRPICSNKGCNSEMELIRHISFVDCPGHDILMATMLNGTAVMDAVILLIAGNEPCPQPQTSEHLAAIEIMKLNNIIILQNKIDLVREKDAAKQYEDIKNFVKGTAAENSPIIPISVQLNCNIDMLCKYIASYIPIPKRDFIAPPRLIIIRSFDINKPGQKIMNLRGGVAGGTLIQGILKIGDSIEIRPGFITKTSDGKISCKPIRSKITSLNAEKNKLKYAVPGGLIGVGTNIDPTLVRADRLVGNVLGLVGQLPDVYIELVISFFLLRRLLGVKSEGDKRKQNRVKKLAKGEVLMVNIASLSTSGRIISVKDDLAKIELTNPVCTEKGSKLALSRRVDKHWRLIGWGVIKSGKVLNSI